MDETPGAVAGPEPRGGARGGTGRTGASPESRYAAPPVADGRSALPNAVASRRARSESRDSIGRASYTSPVSRRRGMQELRKLTADAAVLPDGCVEDNLHAFHPETLAGSPRRFTHFVSGDSLAEADDAVSPLAAAGRPGGSLGSGRVAPLGPGGEAKAAAGATSRGLPAALAKGIAASSRRTTKPSAAFLRAQKLSRQMKATKNVTSAVNRMGAQTMLGKIFGTKNNTYTVVDREVVTEKWILHPDGRARHVWDIFLSCFVITTLFWTPFEIGFSFQTSFTGDGLQVFWAVMDMAMLMFFIVDIFVNFRTAIMDDGELIQEPAAVARKYAKGWFILDLIATIPYDIILAIMFPDKFDGNSTAVAWAQLPRFVRFLRLIRFMRMIRVLKLQKLVAHLQEIGAFASLMGRLGNIAFWVLLIAHVLGCGWFFIADANNLQHNTWAYQHNLHDPGTDLSSKYITSLYWAFVTVTTVGYGDIVPQNDAEKVYVIVCSFIGNSMFAYMIGKITSLASQMDASSALYHEKMDAVNEFMRSKQLPRSLRKRIRKYYDTFWSRGVWFSESDIVSELSFNIRRELAHYMNEDIIRNVPFFRDANELFIDELLTYLKAEVCLPEDYIIREGDTGDKMYLLRKGAVVVEKEGHISHTLSHGAFFGEITLLFPAVRRTASVRALTECEMASLTKADLEHVAEHYPDFMDMMSTVAKSHLRKDESNFKAETAEFEKAQHNPAQTEKRRRPSWTPVADRRRSITKSGAPPGWLAELKSYAAGVEMPSEFMSPKMRRHSLKAGEIPDLSALGTTAGNSFQVGDGSAAQSRRSSYSDASSGAGAGSGAGSGAGGSAPASDDGMGPAETSLPAVAPPGGRSVPSDRPGVGGDPVLLMRVERIEASLARQEESLGRLMEAMAAVSRAVIRSSSLRSAGSP